MRNLSTKGTDGTPSMPSSTRSTPIEGANSADWPDPFLISDVNLPLNHQRTPPFQSMLPRHATTRSLRLLVTHPSRDSQTFYEENNGSPFVLPCGQRPVGHPLRWLIPSSYPPPRVHPPCSTAILMVAAPVLVARDQTSIYIPDWAIIDPALSSCLLIFLSTPYQAFPVVRGTTCDATP